MTDTGMAASAAGWTTPPTRWVEQRQGARDLSDDTFDRVGEHGHDRLRARVGERSGGGRDWRAHVPERIATLWPQLTMLERALASEIAQLAADESAAG